MPILPYVYFDNSTLEKMPEVHAGNLITCPDCLGKHELHGENGSLLFYKCRDKSKLAAVGYKGKSKLVLNSEGDFQPDKTGEIKI